MPHSIFSICLPGFVDLSLVALYLDRSENKAREELKQAKKRCEDLQQLLKKRESGDSSEIERMKTEYASAQAECERLKEDKNRAEERTLIWKRRCEELQLKNKKLEAELAVKDLGGESILERRDNQESSAQNRDGDCDGDPEAIASQEDRQTADIEPGAGYNGSISSEEDEDDMLADNNIAVITESQQEEMGEGGSNVGYQSRQETNEMEEESKSLHADCVEGQVGRKNQATNKGDIQADKNQNLNEYSKPDKKKGGGGTKKPGRREQKQINAERKRKRQGKEIKGRHC